MDFARQQRDPTRHLVGITAVVLVHALVVYALMTGLGQKAIQIIKKPLTATIVEEIKAPPPPPPPPAPPVIAPPPPPPAPPKPVLVRNPTILNACAPQMPGEAIRRNIEGEVTAHLNVDEKGNVTEVKIVKADPPRIFDRAVINALSGCKFPPSSDKWIAEVPLSFKLQ